MTGLARNVAVSGGRLRGHRFGGRGSRLAGVRAPRASPSPARPGLPRPRGSLARPRPCSRLPSSHLGSSHLRPRLRPMEVTTHRPGGSAQQPLNFPASVAIYCAASAPQPVRDANPLTRARACALRPPSAGEPAGMRSRACDLPPARSLTSDHVS